MKVRKFIPTLPIVVSILAVVVWLIFILLYALYWSNGFSMLQNAMVTLVTLIITSMLIALTWVVRGFTRGRAFREHWW
jgi:hypothetical protein